MPGQFWNPDSKAPGRPETAFTPLGAHHHGNKGIAYYHPDLHKAKFVFVRDDASKPALTRSYKGPYRVISRKKDYFELQLKPGTIDKVGIARLKPAFITEDANSTGAESGGSNVADL